ncbi:dihydroorotase-like cyclic amidohydrolase [Leeuwenhoekiella aestuarii]|uniref:Dihydroorotase-like cyclic amidohydrolase n=1 Tax=Leeuwenhoekiella aestuarii TaxID=2249426 RepID=A0A4Q0NR85_9FLAO|nr:amidohydrolase family protein [Leeuwenhoekiella aestuarii]RXG12700.1 dihydroorotase-like cyclic amidohydrolase [Leeuwenhoekiella aestuarii]RXG14647.1 dihydroorotase-like cyclic amidohydrolase [Leeuwenhoekiella aestuarii]
MIAGNKELAIENYKKFAEIDPTNINGAKIFEKLKSKNLLKFMALLNSSYIYFILTFILCFLSCKNTSERHYSFAEEQLSTTILSDSIMSCVKYHENLIAFTNATIVDGTGTSIKQNQTVIIENGIFKEMGIHSDIKIPQNAKTINLKGKTIIPGIVGMHNHLHIPRFPDVGDVAAKLYLASGVTTIQTCGAASPYNELELSKRIKDAKQVGPEIIPSAPFITGQGGNPNMIIPRDTKHLKDTMQHWLDQDVKWFKVYRNTNPNDLKTIIEVAHNNDAKVRGHLCSITFEEATKLGIDAIEHGLNSTSDFRTNKFYGQCNGGREYMDELIINSTEVKRLQQLMIDNKVFLTSTVAIYEASIPNRAFADKRTIKVMSPFLQNQYKERRASFNKQINDSIRNNRLKRIMEFEYQYYKMGGLLCAGVDAGRHVLPGFGDQRNYELLIETGFTTEEAVQIMTGNGAKALDRQDIGTIQVGKRADFVILNGNLENDASTIKNVETVFKEGVGYNSKKILEKITGKFGME